MGKGTEETALAFFGQRGHPLRYRIQKGYTALGGLSLGRSKTGDCKGDLGGDSRDHFGEGLTETCGF